MASGFLKVKGTQIVDGHDVAVTLRGAALGGFLKYVQ
jgi:hypothetical protein